MKLVEVTFEEIFPFWELLWPDRKSPIKPTSSMIWPSGYDLQIAQNYKPCFYAAFENNQIVGVNSGHKSSPSHYRVRGLYIVEGYRKQGIASQLMEKVAERAKIEAAHFLWCTPRVRGIPFFKKLGYQEGSEPTNQGFEYGPNIYMSKTL